MPASYESDFTEAVAPDLRQRLDPFIRRESPVTSRLVV